MQKKIVFSVSISAVTNDEVLIITVDNAPVNEISVDVRTGLERALDYAAIAPNIQGVVITGAGTNFIGNDYMEELEEPAARPSLQAINDRIESMSKPVVAAINGAALDGGLEVALACHYRVALSSALLGLPALKLGLIPGAGGTQRLPRLTGILSAIDLVASGRSATAAEAARLGILDVVVEGDLLDQTISATRELVGKPIRRTGDLAVVLPEHAELEKAADRHVIKARGRPAPPEAIRLIASSTRPLPQGLADERVTSLSLRESAEAAALRHVFFAEHQCKGGGELEETDTLPIYTVGICGLGLMGCGIAVAALAAGFKVIGLDQTQEAAENGRERVLNLLKRSRDAGRTDQARFSEQMARLSVSASEFDLIPCDLIIEAVFDDLAVKRDLFQRLAKLIRPEAILATNTSYLNPDEIAAATTHPERVIGLHFFSPAHIMKLVEVVRCAVTTPQVLSTGLAFIKKLGKLPVITGVAEGFVGNRMFSAYRREAEILLEDGALPHEIDEALEEYGFAMGLFATYDLAGLEIAWSRRKRQLASGEVCGRYVEIADILCEHGRFGQKAGRGWYTYREGERSIDPEVTSIIEAARRKKNIVARAFTKSEIQKRLLNAMIIEGDALLREGVARSPSDIDIVMIYGFGFPAHKGGPMFAASTMT